jgi:hypothetical protein
LGEKLNKLIRRVIPNINWRSFGFRGAPSEKQGDKLLRDPGFNAMLEIARPSTLYYVRKIRNSDGKVVDWRTAHNMVPREGCKNLLAIGFAGQAAPATWYVSVIKQQFTALGGITNGATALTLTATPSQASITGEQVTVFGAGASGANLVTTITTGSATTSQTVANAAGATVSNATVVFGPTFATTDTILTHTNWTEIAGTDISPSARQPLTLPAPFGGSWNTTVDLVSVDNSASTANFTPATNWYACGAFLTTNSAVANTTGYLFGEAGFTQGALSVQGGGVYTLQVTVTLQAQAA